MSKDLASREYWQAFARLGLGLGKDDVPTPKEAAETVLELMAEVARLRDELAGVKCYARGKLAVFETAVMRFTNEMDNARHALREEHE